MKRWIKLFIIRGVGAFSVLGLTIYVTNNMPLESSGIFMYFITMLMMLGIVISFGSGDYIIRLTSSKFKEEPKKVNETISSILLVMSCSSAFFMLLGLFNEGVVYDWLLGSSYKEYAVFFIVCALLQGIIIVLSSFLIGIGENNISCTIQSIIVPFLFVVSCELFEIKELYLALVCYLTSQAFTVFIAVVTVYGYNVRFRLKWTLSKQQVYAIYLFFSVVVVQQITQWSGQIIVARELSSSDLAYFSIAQRTSMITTFILITMNLVYARHFSKLFYNKSYLELEKLSQFVTKLMTVVSLPFVLLIMAFPESILAIFGEEYSEAKTMLLILVTGQVINILTGPVGYLLNMTGYEKDMRNICLICSIYTILVTLILVDVYGAIGASISTASAVALQSILSLIYVKKRLGFWSLKLW